MGSRSHRRRRPSRRTRWLILAVVLALTGALAGGVYLLTRQDAGDHVASAARLEAEGDLKGAQIELKNALQLDPDHAQARFMLGRLYFSSQQYGAAEKELKSARDKGYKGDELPPLLARTWLGLRQPKRVLDEIAVAPGTPPASAAQLLALRARAQLMLNDAAGAEKSLQEAQAQQAGHPDILITRAQMAVSAGRTDEALNLVEQAIARDGRRAELWSMKGDLLRAASRNDEALTAYGQALALEPASLPPRLSSALIHLDTHALDRASADLKEAARHAPDNVMVRYLDALIDFRRARYADAQGKIQPVMRAVPDFLPGHLLSGAANLALGNREAAITHLNRVLERIPEHAYARKLLAVALLGSGELDRANAIVADLKDSNDPLLQSLQGDIALRKRDYAEAGRHFEKAVALAPGNASLLTELAKTRLGSGDTAGALDALNRAAEADTATARPDILLVTTLLKDKRYAEAYAAVDRLEKERPRDPPTHNLRGIIHAAKKDIPSARASFAKALQLNAAYLPAASNLARLDIEANDLKAARGRFAAVLKQDPKQARAWLALAAIAARQNNEAEYLDSLAGAKRADPKDPQAYLLLSRYWLNKRQAGKALAEAREGVTATGRAEFHELIGLAQLQQDDREGARYAFEEWARQRPDDPRAHLQVARSQHQAGDRDAALKALDRALQLAPDYQDALLVKALILAETGQGGEALQLARALQARHPESPAGHLAEAEIMMHDKKPAEAARAFTQAAQLGKNGALMVRAYQAHAASGQARRGMELLTQWLADRPADAAVRHQLANALLAAGDLKEAAEQYAYLYKANPKDLAAANNLAYIYGELKDPRAIATAEQAYKLGPDNPATQDTLGWILVNLGQTQRGLELLRKAHDKLPSSPEIHWHLAAGLAKAGDLKNARVHLEVLLDSGRAFPQRDEALAMFKDLKARIGTRGSS